MASPVIDSENEESDCSQKKNTDPDKSFDSSPFPESDSDTNQHLDDDTGSNTYSSDDDWNCVDDAKLLPLGVNSTSKRGQGDKWVNTQALPISNWVESWSVADLAKWQRDEKKKMSYERD